MSFPRYPQRKNSDVEWIGEVPSTWAMQPLKRHARLLTEKTVRREHPVALENIESWTGRYVPTETEFEGEGVVFQAGDVLFGKLRPYLAKTLVAEATGAAVGDFLVIRPSEASRSRFLAYQLRSREVISIIDGSTYGSKMPRASWEFVGSMPLALPPIGEQISIVTFLDRETAKIDTLVEEQRRLIELLKEKRQAVISQAVTKGLDPSVPMKDSGVEWLGKVPAHWRVSALGKVAVARCDGPFGSGLKSEHYTDEGALVVRLQNIRAGTFNVGEPVFVDLAYFRAELAGHAVNHGDVLIAGLGDDTNLLGRACVAPAGLGPALVKADCFRFRLDESMSPRFVALQLCAGASFDAGTLATGTTRSRIPLGTMATRKIAFPPRAEQDAVVEKLDVMLHELDGLTSLAEESVALLQERRSALISAAVTGKIDVRDIQAATRVEGALT